MTTKPTLLTRAVSLTGAALLAALTLTGCTGGQSAATPDEVFKSYVEALNQGDMKSAIELISDPGEITAENSIHIDDLGKLPTPKLSSDLDLDDKIESTTAYFNFGQDKPYAVSFVKNEGQWQLERPLFFEESRAASDKESTSEFAAQDGRSASTWWEVIDEMDISTKLPSGDEFTFPQYIAGVAPGEHAPIKLTVSDLPDWEYLQKTPFSTAELKIVSQGDENQGYTIDMKLAADPLRNDLLAKAGEGFVGLSANYTDGGGFMRDGKEYQVQITKVADCRSSLYNEPPDLTSPDWKISINCDLIYSDTQFPGEEKHRSMVVEMDREGTIDPSFFDISGESWG